MHALLLVGGFGFLGRNILSTVRSGADFADLTPVVIDDLSNACPDHPASDIEHHVGSYFDPAAASFLGRFPGGRRTFVFLAGETRVADSRDRPMDFVEANIRRPAQFVVETIRPGDHFILASTAGALFDGAAAVTVQTPISPKNFYGATKASQEIILEKLVAMKGGAFSVVRMTNVYGRFSDRKKSAVHAFIRAAITGEPITIHGDGAQSRDFIFADDVGRGVATLAARRLRGDPTPPVAILGAGRSLSLNDVVRTVESVTGRTLERNRIAAEALLATEPRDVVVSTDESRVLLGDAVCAFEDGVTQTYAYYRERRAALGLG